MSGIVGTGGKSGIIGANSSNMTKLTDINQTSSVAGLSIDGFYTTKYDTYIYVINRILFGGTNWLKIQVNTGGTADTAGDWIQSGNYSTLNSSGNANATITLGTNYGQTYFIGPYWGGRHSSFTLTVHRPLATDPTYVHMQGFSWQSSICYAQDYWGTWGISEAITGLYFFPNSNSYNLLQMQGSLYGVS